MSTLQQQANHVVHFLFFFYFVLDDLILFHLIYFYDAL